MSGVAYWRQSNIDGDLWQTMFYTTYTTIRTAIIAPITVVFMFLVLRFAGSRALTQSTLFNRILSVAIGSIVGGAPLRPNTPLTAIVISTVSIVLIALVVDWLYAYNWMPYGLAHTKPVLVYANGKPLTKHMHRCLINPDKLASEARLQGHASWDDVYAMVLEPTGSFSVITKDAAAKGLGLLQRVEGYEHELSALASADEYDDYHCSHCQTRQQRQTGMSV